jgi:hypothetical protein
MAHAVIPMRRCIGWPESSSDRVMPRSVGALTHPKADTRPRRDAGSASASAS